MIGMRVRAGYMSRYASRQLTKYEVAMSKMTEQEALDYHERSMKHWRAWGSWFSWGSPVGLGIFFLACAGTIWIIAQAFN